MLYLVLLLYILPQARRSYSYQQSDSDLLLNPSDELEATPSHNTQGSELKHPLMQSTTVTSSAATTNRSTALPSHGIVTTPPRNQTRSPGATFRVPTAPKSALSVRRSARLAATKRELVHVRVCECEMKM